MKRMTRGQAIRAKCLACCCDNPREVKLCTCVDCALFPYRLGHEDSTMYTDTKKKAEA